jgi:hypothetical protein
MTWQTGPVWADVGPPPTFVIDSLWLGLPWGPVALAALLAAAVTGFVWLRRRVHWALAGVICFVLYAAVNFGCYLYGLEQIGRERERQRQERRLPAPAAPATTGPAVSAPTTAGQRPPG